MASTEVIAAPEEPERKSECTIFLTEKAAKPEGLENIGLTKEISLKVTGKVTRLNTDEWDKGTSLRIEITAISLESDGKDVTLAGAIDSAKKKV